MRTFFVLTLFFCFVAQYAGAASIDDKLLKAQETINNYQNLRDACAESRNKKRQDCLSRLSSASESYREAKLLVLANSSASSRVASNRR